MSTTRSNWLLLVLALTIGGLTMFAADGNARPTEAHSAFHDDHAHLASAVVFSACANECIDYCAMTASHANEGGTSNYGPGHGCEGPYSSTCPHPTCGPGGEDPEGLAEAAASLAPDDLVGLTRILESTVVHFNVERSALQFTGCTVDVVAQVALIPETLQPSQWPPGPCSKCSISARHVGC
jgi:hypothetical protein